jgi:hypothetical protein
MAEWYLGMSLAELFGYLAAACMLTTFAMTTMVPLRLAAIAANCLFIAYGYFGLLYPVVILHLILLPLNVTRLYQMLQLVKKVHEATRGDLSMDWLKPYMSKRRYGAGQVIFRKGDVAEQMFYTVTGRYRLVEISSEIGSGQVIGELGFLSPENRRTQTFECVEEGELLTISYRDLKQLYFQNPKFGFYFLRLASERLFRDIRRLEAAQGRKVV